MNSTTDAPLQARGLIRPKVVRPRSASRIARLLLCSAPLVFAALAVFQGKEAGWDFQNYHWYDPFALLNGRLGFDIGVAHHATYYNPMVDLPLYLLAAHLPSWVAGACLGALFGVAVALIGAIAYYTLPVTNIHRRLALSAALALAGALGGGALPALGNTANDVPAAIGIFAALLLLVKRQSQSRASEASTHPIGTWIVAGVLAGASVGLKLTNMIYALGLCAAVGVMASGVNKRTFNLACFGFGMAIGFALLGGYWTVRLWQYGGNPVFPYFNQLFHSPLLVEGNYRDPNFLPHDALTAWLFPFYFTANSRLVAEWDFRDAHIAALYVLLPLTAVIVLVRPPLKNMTETARSTLFLSVFAAVSYVLWLSLFGVYRYLIPLEMLAPVLIAAALMLWPLRTIPRFAAIAVLLVALQLLVRTDIDDRLPWSTEYVEVTVPQFSDAQHTMVLMAGVAPMAYVIPSFPKQIPFLRIDGWLVSSDDRESGLAREMRARVAAHTGPLYLMFAEYDDERAVTAAQHYGLAFNGKPCAVVRSNIAQSLKLCALTRS